MDKKFLGLTSVLFLAIFVLLASIVSQGTLFRGFNPQAAQEGVTSADRSLLFAWPLTVDLQKSNVVKIDVFARNANDKPIPDKGVVITADLGTIKPIQNPTNKSGQASFSLQSTTPGIAHITATIENLKINQKLSIKFQ